MSAQGSSDGDRTATLVVTALPPPTPSMFRGWPAPIAAINTRASLSRSDGKSAALKYGPFDVPPAALGRAVPSVSSHHHRVTGPMRLACDADSRQIGHFRQPEHSQISELRKIFAIRIAQHRVGRGSLRSIASPGNT